MVESPVFTGAGSTRGMWGWIPASAGITEWVCEVVAALDGDLGGVEADEDYVEVAFEVVGEGVHGFGSLCAVNLSFAGEILRLRSEGHEGALGMTWDTGFWMS